MAGMRAADVYGCGEFPDRHRPSRTRVGPRCSPRAPLRETTLKNVPRSQTRLAARTRAASERCRLMHELSTTTYLMELAVSKALEAGAKRIIRIHVVVGDSSGLIAHSMSFYFEHLRRGTMAEGAQLCFRTVPTRLRCRDCCVEFAPAGDRWNCPRCGELSVVRLQGGEALLESLEVE